MKTEKQISAARATSSLFGMLAGLGGLWHGIGSIQQGSVAPGGIVFNTWAEGPVADKMGGEPAMTVMPNLLLAGILTVVVALAVMIWAALFVGKGRSGWGLIILSIAMLLTGGGFAPPVIGVLAGIAGLGIDAPHNWWRAHLSDGTRLLMARSWPWVFGISVANGAFLFFGSFFLVYLTEFNAPNLFVGSFLFAVISLSVTICTGIAYDLSNGAHRRGSLVQAQF